MAIGQINSSNINLDFNQADLNRSVQNIDSFTDTRDADYSIDTGSNTVTDTAAYPSYTNLDIQQPDLAQLQDNTAAFTLPASNDYSIASGHTFDTIDAELGLQQNPAQLAQYQQNTDIFTNNPASKYSIGVNAENNATIQNKGSEKEQPGTDGVADDPASVNEGDPLEDVSTGNEILDTAITASHKLRDGAQDLVELVEDPMEFITNKAFDTVSDYATSTVSDLLGENRLDTQDTAGTGEVEPASQFKPTVDVTNQLDVQNISDDYTSFQYLSPESGHGIAGFVDEGVLSFNVRAQGDRQTLGSGKDMFYGAVERMKNEGIAFDKIRGTWVPGSDSVNAAEYQKNLTNGMSAEDAAKNTWTGRLAADQGFTKVGAIEDWGDFVNVTFEKPE
jgi:hypothetical protein